MQDAKKNIVRGWNRIGFRIYKIRKLKVRIKIKKRFHEILMDYRS